MKTASLKEIRDELSHLSHANLIETVLRLAKYKKENKELLAYLLFDSMDENNYITEVKSLMNEEFLRLNITNYYLAKKTIRKVLRTTNKYIKYSGNKQTEVELLIHFCFKIKQSKILINGNLALKNLHQRQIDKIKIIISKLHEDLQHDYLIEIEELIS
jgi:vacuolar-type H+-ATPase catalytic subunit A/Vma1